MTLPHHSPMMILMTLLSMAQCTRSLIVDYEKSENGAWVPQVNIPRQDIGKVCINNNAWMSI